MVRLRKKEIKDGVIYYYYQKEGKGEWGLLYYVIATKECGYMELAEDDSEDFPNYRWHAFSRIERYIKENNFPEKDLVAWG